MKKFMNLSLILTVALSASSLVGCAFGNNADEQTAQELQDREKLMQSYSRVIGAYRGSLWVDGNEIPVEASVATVDEQNGTNNKGEPKFIPVLKLRYRQMDTVRPDLIMTTRFIPADASINAVSGLTTLRGNLQGESILGTVFNGEGTLGKFEITRYSISPNSPLKDPQAEYLDRLRVQYKEIAGVYKGVMTNDLNKKETTVDMNVTYYDEVTNGVRNVVLRVVLIHPEQEIPLSPVMTAYFQLETIPAELFIGGGGWSVLGFLEGDTFSGKVSKIDGTTARLTAIKKK